MLEQTKHIVAVLALAAMIATVACQQRQEVDEEGGEEVELEETETTPTTPPPTPGDTATMGTDTGTTTPDTGTTTGGAAGARTGAGGAAQVSITNSMPHAMTVTADWGKGPLPLGTVEAKETRTFNVSASAGTQVTLQAQDAAASHSTTGTVMVDASMPATWTIQ